MRDKPLIFNPSKVGPDARPNTPCRTITYPHEIAVRDALASEDGREYTSERQSDVSLLLQRRQAGVTAKFS